MSLRLRASVVARAGKQYRYYQLVRAVRRNGKPTHDIVAHIGRLSDEESAAIRQGLKVRPPTSAPAQTAQGVRVKLNDIAGIAALRYLDVAVVWRLWERWGFRKFFADHLQVGRSQVPPEDVVLSLVANRCVAPCSKLRVTEWVPRTALPEMLGFRPSQMNNTRIHRVLECLEGIEPELTRFLVNHPTRRARADSVIYLDVTSTWFEGQGGTLGQRTRTKEGAIRQHVIQLALAVDAYGLPLQWEVLPGKKAESKILPSWVISLARHEELAGLPLSFDRGLATEGNLLALLDAKQKFVTCYSRIQIENWGLGVDLEALAATPEGQMPDREALLRAGLKATEHKDIYHVDRGVEIPLNMDRIPAPGLRVVPYFRPSLFHRHRDSLARLRANVLGKLDAINLDLRQVKHSRSEEKSRKKVEGLLEHFDLQDEYRIRMEPITLPSKKTPLRSFQAFIDPVEGRSSRELNAGWMVLLAHPQDTRSPLELVQQYHQKEVVEHSFGVIKSFVDLRPIRHQTDPKIKAHVTLCVLGLLLDRSIELTLREEGLAQAVDRVWEALEPCRLQVLSDQGRRTKHFVITDVSPEQNRLLGALGLSHLSEQQTAQSLSRRRY